MPQCILKYHKMWNDRRFHFIIWYISSYRAVAAGNKQGCCMTHSKALRKALRLYARIPRCHCQGVHIPQVSHKWLSLNINISKVFYQPPPDSAPLPTNDCVHLGNVDIFPFCRNQPWHWHHHSSCVSEAFSKADIWTTTRRHTVKSIHVWTMTQSSSLSIFFHPWSNSGSPCAFPSYHRLRARVGLSQCWPRDRHAYDQFRITSYSNSHMFFWTLGGSWCTRTEPTERPQFWSQDRLQQHASIFICISYFCSTKQIWGHLRTKSHFCFLNSVLANKHIK